MRSQDIEAELSYAYLHAVASSAGIACQATTRSHDNLGIDASLSLTRDFGAGATLTEISLNVQLKATTKPTTLTDAGWSYSLAVTEYNRLRRATQLPPRLLIVLFLPTDHASWLSQSDEQLIMQRCAYWLSLVGAPETNNSSERTVYFPAGQVLSPAGLTEVFRRIACREELRYAE